MPELPQALTIFLPVLTMTLSGWLSHNQLKLWVNGVIVIVVTLFSAFIWALITPPLTPSFWGNVAILTGYCIALAYGPLMPLYLSLMEKLPSPFSILFQQVQGPLSAISLKSVVSSAIAPPTPTTWRATTQSWPAAQTGDAQAPGESVIDKPVPTPEQTPPS